MTKDKILIIDCDPINRDILARRLRRQGHTVEIAHNGAQGLTMIEDTAYTVVLLDLTLCGDMTGLDLVIRLQDMGMLQQLPVIVICDNDDMHQVAQCIERGAEDYLVKPLNHTLLKARISASLEKKRMKDQEKAYLRELKNAKESAERSRAIAESANQAKSTFLANMSHELRTPLNVILGFSQLMTRSSNLSDEQRENLNTINRSGDHLLTLINQILDLSKIEAGYIALEENDFNLYRFLAILEDMFLLRASKKNVRFAITRQPEVPENIRTDELKLRQILINLIHNALKFTDEGQVLCHVGWQEERLHFTITDTGPGIPEDERDRLFEVFVQTEAGHRAQEGTGLGLAISQRYVKLLGGEIQVESTAKQGSTFRFAIPVQTTTPSEKNHAPYQSVTGLLPGQRTAEGTPYRILVVDDHAANRQLIIKLLNQLDAHTFTLKGADDGQAAIDLWHSFRPHFLFMDMRLPLLDGWAAASRIKATAIRDRKTPPTIIGMTAGSIEELQAENRLTGCDHVLTKPVREADIFEVLHTYLGIRFTYDADLTPEGDSTRDRQRLRRSLAAMPTEWREGFYDAIVALDVSRMSDYIEGISSTWLSATVTTMVADYEYDLLLDMLSQPKR